jgi:predicted permease
MFATYADQSRSFDALGIWNPGSVTVTGVGRPEQIRAIYATDGALRAFGIAPIFGKLLSRSDIAPGSAAVVILSYGYWQSHFSGERSILGRTIAIDSRSRVVSGVMPRDFRFANETFDVLLPLTIDRSRLQLAGFGYHAIARLSPGKTMTEAGADLARLIPVWQWSWPHPAGVNPSVYDSWRITPAIRPLKHDVVGGVDQILWAVMGTVGVVLLIVCANVANLLLVRAEARRQELAVRAALGAGRIRMIRESLSESLLLAAIGGTLGLAAAALGLRLLRTIGPGNLPRLNEVSLDWRTGAFAMAISLVAGVAAGLLPALRYAGSKISSELRAGGRALSESRERHHARNLLVVAQVAMAFVLLVCAGLMIRTVQALRHVEPGFADPEHLELVRTSIGSAIATAPERVTRTENEIVDKLSAIPGVASVGFASEMPMDGNDTDWDAVRIEGQALGSEIPPIRVFRFVSPGLFQTMGTRLTAGRDYTWADLYGRRPGVLVSENMARELWGSARAAVGKRLALSLPQSPLREVIGVVEDVHDAGLHKPASKVVYWPAYGDDLYGPSGSANATKTVTFAIRTTRAGSESLLSQIQQAVWSVNAELPLDSVQTMRDVSEKSFAQTSFALVMLSIAGGMALLLGVIGIYGVLAYTVSQKRREIGIRLALGAQQTEVRRMFVFQGLALTGTGAVLGLAAAAGLTQLMRSLLFGISTLDPVTYVGTPLVLLLAAMIASYIPARRAAAVHPVEALRGE